MKKFFTMVAIAVAMMFAANNANAQISVRAGFLNDIYGGDADATEAGFYLGASYNMHAFGDFNVAPGVYFGYSKDRMDLRIPVLLNFGLNLTDDLGLVIFAGPQATIGLAGDVYDAYKRFGLGLTFGAGLTYQKVSFELGYSLGFLNHWDGTGDYKVNFNQFTIGLGYAL